MAESLKSGSGTEFPTGRQKYFCYVCIQEISVFQDLTCPICFGGFIEEVPHNSEDSISDKSEPVNNLDASTSSIQVNYDDLSMRAMLGVEPRSVFASIRAQLLQCSTESDESNNLPMVRKFRSLSEVENEDEDKDEDEDEWHDIEDDEPGNFQHQTVIGESNPDNCRDVASSSIQVDYDDLSMGATLGIVNNRFSSIRAQFFENNSMLEERVLGIDEEEDKVDDEVYDEDEDEDENEDIWDDDEEDDGLEILRQQSIINRGDNRWDTTGLAQYIQDVMDFPFPLTKDQMEAIPVILIRKEHVEKGFQCTVCLEDFKLNEEVRNLPCDHFFHQKCINPWLERQVTCPVCRKLISIAESSKDKSSENPLSRETRNSRSENSARSSSQSSSRPNSLQLFFETYNRLNL